VKIIALILSFYFLALNALPCSDNGINDNSKTEVLSSSNLDHNHTAFDQCPPFCTCHCCHVHTADFASANFKPINTEISSKVFFHFDRIGDEPILSLLDPPKV